MIEILYILANTGVSSTEPWWSEVIRQGGLAAVCIILAVVAWILLKLYLKERSTKDDGVQKYIADTAVLERQHQAYVDARLKEQSERYQQVIKSKDSIIERLERKNDELEKQFRADLSKFLEESIEARHQITQSMEALGRDNKENASEIIRTLQNMS